MQNTKKKNTHNTIIPKFSINDFLNLKNKPRKENVS